MVQFFNAFGVDVFKLAFQIVNFLLLLWLLNRYMFKPVTRMLDERSERIRRGLEDAEAARRERERSEAERAEALQAARREANDIINRAAKAAQDLRDADVRATREELERLRERAAADIEMEKEHAIADLRAEVADLALAAAGKLIGESMDRERQRRLVEEFLAEPVPVGAGAGRVAYATRSRVEGAAETAPETAGRSSPAPAGFTTATDMPERRAETGGASEPTTDPGSGPDAGPNPDTAGTDR